jgi:S-adenosylmethionine:tRNA ribosyltransferase-isomerase
MNLSDFDFYLPENLIANEPLAKRDDSKLLCLNRQTGEIAHKRFFDLAKLLRANDVLVRNVSRVIPARINFKLENKDCEIFLVRELSENKWLCLVRRGKFFQEGSEFELSENLKAKVESINSDGTREIKFHSSSSNSRAELFAIGKTPLPPYIKNSQATDNSYQTVYAQKEGSVAAPTAGLHFTSELLGKLEAKGVEILDVCLHVGLGTFLPVKSEKITQHKMHEEFYEISNETLQKLQSAKAQGKRIIAVGTTSMRVLESCFRDLQNPKQSAWTDIFIYPGFKFNFVDALITNFHLPKSSLIMLVCAFAGFENAMRAYKVAIQESYRFYSFGDAMFIGDY